MAYNASSPETLLGLTLDEFGEEFAAHVTRHWGGMVVFIPTKPNPENLFLEFVGPDRANFYCEYLGNDSYYIPSDKPGAHLKAVALLSAEGMRVIDIARRIGISERQTYALRAQLRAQRLEHGERDV